MNEALSYNDVLLVPRYSEVNSRQEVSLSSKFSKRINLEVPIVSSCMDSVTEGLMARTMQSLGGNGIIHRFMSIEDRILESDKLIHALVAIGINEDYMGNAQLLIDHGIDGLVVDTANGYLKKVMDVVKKLKNKFPAIDIIAGNVVTAEGVKFLGDAGADAIRVGIGSSGICSTRLVSGVGYPQFSAVVECAREAKKYKIPIIADGGINHSGDIVKALAAGASSVMIGRLFSGTEEAPGEVKSDIWNNKIKIYRGMASKQAMESKSLKLGERVSLATPEGISITVPYKGSVSTVFQELAGGIRSGLSYVGAFNLDQLRKNAKFIRITHSGWQESLTRS